MTSPQVVSKLTHNKGNCIDLVLTSSPEAVGSINVSPNSLLCLDHYLVSFSLSANRRSSSPAAKCRYVLDHSKLDYERLVDYLLNYDYYTQCVWMLTQFGLIFNLSLIINLHFWSSLGQTRNIPSGTIPSQDISLTVSARLGRRLSLIPLSQTYLNWRRKNKICVIKWKSQSQPMKLSSSRNLLIITTKNSTNTLKDPEQQQSACSNASQLSHRHIRSSYLFNQFFESVYSTSTFMPHIPTLNVHLPLLWITLSSQTLNFTQLFPVWILRKPQELTV